VPAPLLALLLACSGPPEPPPAAPPAPAPPPRTPVVIITLDTTRADRIGCYGYADAETPAIDALASRGTRFARAYTPVPLTIPAHSSLFTGLLPPHHGVRDNGDQRLAQQATTLAERLAEHGWTTHAAVAAFVTQAHWGFGQGFDGYDDNLGVPSDRLSWRAERDGGEVVDQALAAIDGGADFLWVHLFEPHSPYEPPEPFRSRHAGRPYDGEIAAVDAQVGRLLAALPSHTLIVLAGDHGEALGEGGEQQHGLLLGDATLHVPLILAGPGVPVGVLDQPVSLVDVAPTLLRILELPADPGMDGRDLFEVGPRPGVYAETHYGTAHYGWAPLRAIIGTEGRVVSGARAEHEGQVDDAMLAALEASAAGQPLWQPEPVTLGMAEIEQLQALGYLGATEPTQPLDGAIDPRDGIHAVKRLSELGALPPAEQEAELRSLLADNPGFRDARFRLVMALSRSGRLHEATAELAGLYERTPDSTAAITMAQLWMQLGDPGEALHWFREAATHDPRSMQARAGEVEALAAMGLADEARAVADLALLEAPDHAALLAGRSLLALADGEPLGSWPDTIAAIASERPYEPRLPWTAARLLAAAGRPEEAITQLRSELAWRPHSTGARLELYALFSEHGRNVDAIKTLRPLLALQPDEPQWQILAARTYLAMGRKDLAQPHRDACAGAEGCP
jgi:thioredoxin-like negative regulator of GroEL